MSTPNQTNEQEKKHCAGCNTCLNRTGITTGEMCVEKYDCECHFLPQQSVSKEGKDEYKFIIHERGNTKDGIYHTQHTADKTCELCSSQESNWEKEFSVIFPYRYKIIDTEKVKDFIRKVRQEAYWEGIKVMEEEVEKAISAELKEVEQSILKAFEKLDEAEKEYPMAIVSWSKKDRENWIINLISNRIK